MNRRFVWLWGLATAAIAAVVGVGAYIAGTANHVVTATGGDGRVYYPGYWGFGFFPDRERLTTRNPIPALPRQRGRELGSESGIPTRSLPRRGTGLARRGSG
jgi:hypothetical protein